MNASSSKKPVIFITGGSRGIGLAVVTRFKQQGWTVATCATRLAHLDDCPADFKLECDISQATQAKGAIGQVIDQLGRMDAIVNNSGIAGTNPMAPSTSDDFWHRIVDVNLNGTYYVSKYGAPHLPDGSGRIVNIASVLALKGVPDQTAYCAAKHGVLGFTRSLAHFLAPRRITANAVCPGWVRTEMASGRMKEIGISESDLSTHVPLGRFVEPREVADLVYFLTQSEASAMMTGQAFTIDGGVLA